MEKVSARRNSGSGTHRFSSTSTRCMIAIWPAGPPKLMKPSLSQKRSASANEITSLGEGAAAGAPGARGTAEAMARGDDRARGEPRRIEVANVRELAVAIARIELEHLVEVAVVDAPVPAYRQRAAAHQPLHRALVVGVDQQLHLA